VHGCGKTNIHANTHFSENNFRKPAGCKHTPGLKKEKKKKMKKLSQFLKIQILKTSGVIYWNLR